MRARVSYRNCKEVFPPPPLGSRPQPLTIEYVDHDIHTIEDHDSVMRDAYGYLSIVDTDGDVFLYPTNNLVKVDIVNG